MEAEILRSCCLSTLLFVCLPKRQLRIIYHVQDNALVKEGTCSQSRRKDHIRTKRVSFEQGTILIQWEPCVWLKCTFVS